jgi:hypothetical protein
VSQNEEPEATAAGADQRPGHVPDFSGDVAEMAPHYYGVEHR